MRLFGFRDDPNWRTSRGIRVHAAAILRTVGRLIAGGAFNSEANLSALARLGKTHAARIVKPKHFLLFLERLLETLAARLGEQWTPDVALAWRTAVELCASTIVQNFPVSSSETSGPGA